MPTVGSCTCIKGEKMTIWELFAELGIGYTLAIVSLGAFMIGFITGCLSVLFVLQKRSIIGDALAHSALPGIGGHK